MKTNNDSVGFEKENAPTWEERLDMIKAAVKKCICGDFAELEEEDYGVDELNLH